MERCRRSHCERSAERVVDAYNSRNDPMHILGTETETGARTQQLAWFVVVGFALVVAKQRSWQPLRVASLI